MGNNDKDKRKEAKESTKPNSKLIADMVLMPL